MIIGGLVIIGAISAGGWIHHHLLLRQLQNQVADLKALVSAK